MMIFKRFSIATKLSASIILLQIITMYCTLAILMYNFWREQSFIDGLITDSEVEMIASHVTFDLPGKLTLNKNEDIKTIIQSPGAWIFIREKQAGTLVFGKIPEEYKNLAQNIEKYTSIQLNSTAQFGNKSMKLLTRNVQGRLVQVMVGGVATYNNISIFTSAAKTFMYYLFLPTAIVTVLLIPLITRRILSGISSAANDARNINENDHRSRLREKGIPREIVPLVKAVNAALHRLSEGYIQRDRFLSSAAHELRAPIAILEARLSIVSDAKVRRVLENDVSRLSNLAESLLDLQRLSQGHEHFRTINLKEILRQVVSDYSPLIISAGYEIEFIDCDKPVFVWGDPASLSRAVVNILQNAVIYGGGKGMISVSLYERGIVTIEDEGKGIIAEQRVRIFEPFHRITPRFQGAGLGLHLVNEIIHIHKGRVTAGEGRRGGALFEIRLPVSQETD